MDTGQLASPRISSSRKKIIGIIMGVLIILGMQPLTYESIIDAWAIPSGSMEGTITTGDNVYTEHVSYSFRDVEVGDIITFEDPEIPGKTLIKRCIAIGGQTIDMQKGVLYVDGVAQSEPYTQDKPSNPLSRTCKEITYPYTVPEGYIWVMGDNRTNSADSRYFGSVPVSSVSGRAFLIFWPLEHFSTL